MLFCRFIDTKSFNRGEKAVNNFVRIGSFFLLLVSVLIIGGCVPMGVKVWERDVLAKPEMELNADSYDRAFDDHIYFSKEASSGGRSFSGGGCGCN